MPVERTLSHEAIVKEILAATLLMLVSLAAELATNIRGAETSLERLLMAMASGLISWFAVRATIPYWPLGRRLVLCLVVCAAVNLTADVRVYENLTRFGTVHTGSDDSFYLKAGSQFATMLRDAGDVESYAYVYSSLPYTPHIGFIVLLGHLFTLVPADSMSQLRMVVLLNLCGLQLLIALVIRLGGFLPKNLGLVLFLFLVPGFDLFFFAAEVRKDPLIVLLVVALMGCMFELAERKASVRRLGMVLTIVVTLFFLRNFYVALPIAAMVLTRLRDQKGGPFRRMAARAAVLVGMAGASYLVLNSVWFQEVSLSNAWNMTMLDGGWAAKVYNVPLLGPLLYGLITPLPPRLSELASGTAFSDLMRSVGTAATLILLGVQAALAIRTRAVNDKRWRTFLHLGMMIFLLSAYGSLEARHRLGALPCILICFGLARQREAALAHALPASRMQGAGARLHPGAFLPAVSR